MNANSCEEEQETPENKYPRMAPRVLASYLFLRTRADEPTSWTSDDYDGFESWEEERQRPPKEFERDVEINADQYHKLMHQLYQYEGETDELLEKRDNGDDRETQIYQWKRIRFGVQRMCMEMYREVEHGESDDGINEAKQKAQLEYAQQEKHLQMFEKGKKTTRNRRVVEDLSSDEQSVNQLVCNMIGANWESSPFPIIVDSRGMCLCNAHELVRPRTLKRDPTIKGRGVLPCGKRAKDQQTRGTHHINDDSRRSHA